VVEHERGVGESTRRRRVFLDYVKGYLTTTTSSKFANEMRNAELNLKEATVIYDFYNSKIAQTSAKVLKVLLLVFVFPSPNFKLKRDFLLYCIASLFT